MEYRKARRKETTAVKWIYGIGRGRRQGCNGCNVCVGRGTAAVACQLENIIGLGEWVEYKWSIGDGGALQAVQGCEEYYKERHIPSAMSLIII